MPRLPVLILSTLVLLVGASTASADPPTVVEGQTQPVNSGYCSFPVLMRRAAILAACGLAASAALPAATAAPSRAGDPGPARRLLVRYFDAIRDNDKTTACRMYRLPHCADRTPYVLDAYELAVLERLPPPAEGDWGSLVYLYAPRRTNGTRDVAMAIAVVTCHPGCRITGFWGVAS